MPDPAPVPTPPPAATDRMSKLEARVAALELKLTTGLATADATIRNLKREMGAVNRAMTNRGGSGGGRHD